MHEPFAAGNEKLGMRDATIVVRVRCLEVLERTLGLGGRNAGCGDFRDTSPDNFALGIAQLRPATRRGVRLRHGISMRK
jgi:hypothetical protein